MQHQITIDSARALAALFGSLDENSRLLEEELGVRLQLVGDALSIEGEPNAVELAGNVISPLIRLIDKGENIDRGVIRYAIGLARQGKADAIGGMIGNAIAVTVAGKPIKPRTHGQQEYVNAMRKNEVVLAVGPAGTGKTFLAMAIAAAAFRAREVSRIILSRPAVEAGERLGFLPGDLQQKVDPYLRPLYDALHQLLGPEAFATMQEKGIIEVAPLAYMRGRTLSDSFLILDEAQNTTTEQMKMFLTRMGQGSCMVVTGDITQIDLPSGQKSGLVQATEVLTDVEGVAVCRLTNADIVRHELVARILRAYDKHKK